MADQKVYLDDNGEPIAAKVYLDEHGNPIGPAKSAAPHSMFDMINDPAKRAPVTLGDVGRKTLDVLPALGAAAATGGLAPEVGMLGRITGAFMGAGAGQGTKQVIQAAQGDPTVPKTSGDVWSSMAKHGLLEGALPQVLGESAPTMMRGSLRMMQSALKPTQALVNARTGAGFPTKESIAQAVLNEGRIVSPGSATNAQTALDATDAAAHTAIQQGAGQGITVDPFKVTAAIDARGTAGQFGKQINAQPDTSAIQAVHENFAANPHVSDPVTGMAPMSAELAHDFAINTGKNLKGKFGRLGAATVEAEKAGREAITSDLRQQIPALEPLWKQEAQQITTRDALDQALARRSNTDPIGLGGIIGSLKNPALAATAMADRSALLKSVMAQALRKGSGAVPSANAIRLALIAALRGGSEPPQDPQGR